MREHKNTQQISIYRVSRKTQIEQINFLKKLKFSLWKNNDFSQMLQLRHFISGSGKVLITFFLFFKIITILFISKFSSKPLP